MALVFATLVQIYEESFYEETDFINKKLIEPEQMFEVTIKELRFR